MRLFRLQAENNLRIGHINKAMSREEMYIRAGSSSRQESPSRRSSPIVSKDPRQISEKLLLYHNMKSFLISLLALAVAVTAAPAPQYDGGDQCGCVGTCDTIGEMQCCGTGFVTCDYSGWVYRDCGPGTTCYQLPAPGPLFCGWPAGQPGPGKL